MLSGNAVSAPGEGTRLDSDSELLLVKLAEIHSYSYVRTVQRRSPIPATVNLG